MSKECDMSLPEYVPSGAAMYEVVVSEFPDEDDAETVRMSCGPAGKQLWMLPEYADGRAMLIAYFHGVIHCAEEEYGIKISHKDLDRTAQAVTQAFIALMEAQ